MVCKWSFCKKLINFVNFFQIAAFLDPTTYRFLSNEDIAEGERLLLSEYDMSDSFNRLHINTAATTMTLSSTATSSSPIHQRSSSSTSKKSSLDDFFHVCEMTTKSNTSTIPAKNNLSFKEELCHYMSTAGSSTTFSEYWCDNETVLSKLSRFVKLYNCIPATSVPSESAFSIAEHYQRKARSSLSSTALRYFMVLRQ